LERRIRRKQEQLQLERKAAVEHIEKADRGHQRYVREHFKAEIDDPLRYDLVINTDSLEGADAAHLIAEALLRRVPAGGLLS
jgi:cytidylate kinase